MNRALNLAVMDEDEEGGPDTQEAQLVQLHINYNKLTEHYETYKRDMAKRRCMENAKVVALEKERKLLTAILSSVNSPELRQRDAQMGSDLAALLNGMKVGHEEILKELDNIRKDGLLVEEWEDKLWQQRISIGGTYGLFERRVQQQRRKRMLENRLQKMTNDFCTVLACNRTLRDQISDFRNERAIFDYHHSKLVVALEAIKKQKSEILQASQIALENRQEAIGKMQALKEADDKEQATFEANMKVWNRTLHQDACVGEFMVTKLNTRQDYKNIEAVKRDRATKAAYEADKLTLAQHSEAFESMQEVTDQQEIEGMISNFINKEAENFALFNYVSALNGDIEALSEELVEIRADIARLHEDEKVLMEAHLETMKELEEQYARVSDVTNKSEAELKRVNQIHNELMAAVLSTFTRIGCSERLLEDLLGLDTTITSRNLIVYLGQIEHRAVELLNILHYIAIKRSQQYGEHIPIRPDLGSYNLKPVLELDISLPTMGERDADSPEYDVILESKILSREELTNLALVNIENRVINQQRLAKAVDTTQVKDKPTWRKPTDPTLQQAPSQTEGEGRRPSAEGPPKRKRRPCPQPPSGF